MPFETQGYRLFKKTVTFGGQMRPIYFFTKKSNVSGAEATDVPTGYEVNTNTRSGLPVLQKIGGEAKRAERAKAKIEARERRKARAAARKAKEKAKAKRAAAKAKKVVKAKPKKAAKKVAKAKPKKAAKKVAKAKPKKAAKKAAKAKPKKAAKKKAAGKRRR